LKTIGRSAGNSCRLTTHGYADAAQRRDGRFRARPNPMTPYPDLGLPVLDDFRCCKAGGSRKTPVLVLTARDTWSDKCRSARGADDYLAAVSHGGTDRAGER
jgi:DNA-binding response OmpR family regulator